MTTYVIWYTRQKHVQCNTSVFTLYLSKLAHWQARAEATVFLWVDFCSLADRVPGIRAEVTKKGAYLGEMLTATFISLRLRVFVIQSIRMCVYNIIIIKGANTEFNLSLSVHHYY